MQNKITQIEQCSNISIIIPTYQHLDSFLKQCCTSIIENTALSDIEVIIVANGCSDNTQKYVLSLGKPFKLLNFDEPIGYTKAINEGLKISRSEYIILLNDDVKILSNTWISILLAPFKQDNMTGITGPVKFIWPCGGINRTAIAFWCCMFKRSLIEEIGYLNEEYSPGMGEDGEFSVKAELIGYKLVQVPVDESKIFGDGVRSDFPIWHAGNGTFAEIKNKDDIRKRNDLILEKRLANRLEVIYHTCLNHKCDINDLFPILRRYSSKCSHLTEFGVRGVFSTYAFLSARPKRMISYDIETSANIYEAKNVAKESNIDFEFKEQDVLAADIEMTDLLFIDTLHTYKQLSQELKLHSDKVKKYIIMHDTHEFGLKDEVETNCEKKGLKQAIDEFVNDNPQWQLDYQISESNGLTILKRTSIQLTKVQFSIIIPTCNNNSDNINNCLDRVFQYTDLTNKEIIVVSNGCDSKTLSFLNSLDRQIILIDLGQKSGVPKAVNAGASIAQGKFIILLDDDSFLLPQNKDKWIDDLYLPFLNNVNMGVTGPIGATYDGLDGKIIHSGCAMYKKEAWDTVCGYDEQFGIGYLSDSDISLRIQQVGYKAQIVGQDRSFPLYHAESPATTERKQKDADILFKNRKILYERHTRMKPKFSIIVPTYNHLDDCLKPCLESIVRYTNLDDVEVIVVANGCKDNTAEFVNNLGKPFKLIWIDEGIGFTRATNIGIIQATGDYIVLLNNDTVLLEQVKNSWIEMLVAPFEPFEKQIDRKVGITGPLSLYDNYAGDDVMIFFCVMIKKQLFDELGLLDEIFSPGGGEDIDFCMKTRLAGYEQIVVPGDIHKATTKEGVPTNSGGFPIYHMGEGTFTDAEFPEYSKKIIKDNGLRNMIRYNKHIKLNLGSGGVEVPGYMSVDKFDTRAHVLMDVMELQLPENSVEEILASHLLEHINPYHVTELLTKWCKILKPGGKLIMEMPDIEALCKEFVSTTDKQTRYQILNCIYCPLRTTEGGAEITSPHLFGWYPEILHDHLIWAGFKEIVFMPEQIPHPSKNFRVEATKL